MNISRSSAGSKLFTHTILNPCIISHSLFPHYGLPPPHLSRSRQEAVLGVLGIEATFNRVTARLEVGQRGRL